MVLESFGGPEVLKAAEVPDPEPGAGEVLLRVRACALNHLDLWVRDGIPAYKIKPPHILGCDVSGEIVALGPAIREARVGQRVSVNPGRSCLKCPRCLAGEENLCSQYGIIGAQAGPGGYAELLSVPEQALLPLPESLSFEEGAAYPLTFLTAWRMLMTVGGCGPGQYVLVLGAGSGVGVAAVQIARLAGAKAIAVSTSQEKLARAKALGAWAVIHSPPGDILKETIRLTEGRRADIAFEHVGPAVFEAALKSLKNGGRLVTCGATSGHGVTLDLRYIFGRQLQILGSTMGNSREMREVARLVGEKKLIPVIDRVFPLEEARRAHEYLAEKKHFGKVVLKI